jgi:predicted nucleotidyltransferase
MLKEINNLKPFFEDITKETAVREYARLLRISPPAASKTLKSYAKQGMLKSRKERRALLFKANTESRMFKDLMILYNKIKLESSGLPDELEKKFNYPTIILFGSFAKAEDIPESDIDLCIISMEKKQINLEKFEKELKHKIQIFNFTSFSEIKNKELLNNILNGIILRGEINLK